MNILQVRQQFRSSCSSSCPPPSCQFPLPATNSISPLYTLTSTSSLPSTSPTRWEIDVIMVTKVVFYYFSVFSVSNVIFILTAQGIVDLTSANQNFPEHFSIQCSMLAKCWWTFFSRFHQYFTLLIIFPDLATPPPPKKNIYGNQYIIP